MTTQDNFDASNHCQALSTNGLVARLEEALRGLDDEAARLSAFDQYGILDTPPEQGFDDVVFLASQLCRTPIALVTLLAADRQWFKARLGFEPCETPLAQSVCVHALRQTGLLVIPDLTQDPRTRDNPLVAGEPYMRFYAGARLETSDGVGLGTVCVTDTQPRPGGLTPAQGQGLEALARQVMVQLEMRRALGRRDRAVGGLAVAEHRVTQDRDRLMQMFVQAPGFMAMLGGSNHVIELANDAYLQISGNREVLGRTARDAFPDLEGQGYFEILDRVYATGEPYVGRASRVLYRHTPEAAIEERFVDFVYQPITEADGRVRGIFLEGSDVTRQVANERKLERARQVAEEATKRATAAAVTDHLTGLANRQEALRWLDKTMVVARRTSGAASVILFDIDHLDRVNDAWGHAAGDEVLRRVAHDASQALGIEGCIGRLGGGEFLMVLPDVDQAAATATAERVRMAVQAGGGDLETGPSVSVSLGVATWSGEDTADRLLHRARRAMLEAKRSGRSRPHPTM